ncbi:MAG: hypothetical protein ACTIAM_04700 [Pseudolactococcus laudensis]
MTSETLFNLIMTTGQKNPAILMIGSEGSRNTQLSSKTSIKITTSPTLFQMLTSQLLSSLIATTLANS